MTGLVELREGAAERRASDDLEDLVKRLARVAESSLGDAGPPDSDVVLDEEVAGFRCVLTRTTPLATPVISLSPREQEIARMVAKGYTNKTIARVLEISAWTVSTHLRRIFTKLDVGSRTAMTSRLIEEGLLHAVNKLPGSR